MLFPPGTLDSKGFGSRYEGNRVGMTRDRGTRWSRSLGKSLLQEAPRPLLWILAVFLASHASSRWFVDRSSPGNPALSLDFWWDKEESASSPDRLSPPGVGLHPVGTHSFAATGFDPRSNQVTVPLLQLTPERSAKLAAMKKPNPSSGKFRSIGAICDPAPSLHGVLMTRPRVPDLHVQMIPSLSQDGIPLVGRQGTHV